MISVLCPTRGRPLLLTRSVATLIKNASDPDNVQVCYAVDADDTTTIECVQGLMRRHDVLYVSGQRRGYGGLHIYVNELARQATGKWLLLWNDDAVMLTEDWDEIVEAHDSTYVLSAINNHGNELVTFPFVPKRFIEQLGHFSLSPHNDTWWQRLGGLMNRVQWIEVEILHDRFDLTGNNNDETYRDTRAQALWEQTSDHFWRVGVHLIDEDMQVLTAYLQSIGVAS